MILFKSNSTIYTYDNGFIDTGLSSPVSETEFENNGVTIEDVSNIPQSEWTNFNKSFDILVYSEDNESGDEVTVDITSYQPEFTPILKEVTPSEIFAGVAEVYVEFEGDDGSIDIPDDYNFERQYIVNLNTQEFINNTDYFPNIINFNIPIGDLNNGTNNIKIELDNNISEYTVIKEDRNTFTLTDRFQYDKSYQLNYDSNISLGSGINLSKDTGKGEIIIEVPTDGKYKITNISSVTKNESEGIKTHSDTMTNEGEM